MLDALQQVSNRALQQVSNRALQQVSNRALQQVSNRAGTSMHVQPCSWLTCIQHLVTINHLAANLLLFCTPFSSSSESYPTEANGGWQNTADATFW
jgi:hypothetical protein